MRRVATLLIGVVACACAGAPTPTPEPTVTPFPPSTPPPACTFLLGFAEFQSAIPQIVGTCVENERPSGTAGDSSQRTTRGLLVWRKADGLIAFTDGGRTWVRGPTGEIFERANHQRFTWEAGLPGTPPPPIATPGAPVRPSTPTPTTTPPPTVPPGTPAPTPGSRRLSMDQIVQSLTSSDLPISAVTPLTATTDPNRLLGQPGQYSGKVVWRDARAPDAEVAIELFEDADALENRRRLLDEVSRASTALAQHLYTSPSRLALVRVPRALSEDQARIYEAWLARL